MKAELFDFRDKRFNLVKDVRKAVFTEEQGIAVNDDIDCLDSDERTVYCLVKNDNGLPCATGRLIVTENGFKIGRIATLKIERQKGFGSVIVNALCDKAARLGADFVYLEAQLHAVKFYESLGFKVISDEIIIDRGIEHLKMGKECLN